MLGDSAADGPGHVRPGTPRRPGRLGDRGHDVVGVLQELMALVGQRDPIGMAVEEPRLQFRLERLDGGGDRPLGDAQIGRGGRDLPRIYGCNEVADLP